ncbi:MULTISPECIES: cytochrome P450 [unclassified Crossiella]|uniref:cytochrome P450 n=1 Tax=unclassified Crossiella TaxID=2620835 RepID=UPI001FFF2F4D|nr:MULTISPECIES: cytochrome P450 [unclassified Crossiella]MCK2242552.1 cytochrome P450 [Crossiella sp. S99.2]MCK2254418.1 cytochrome P450 [Crossiella sp. S99.1]
MRATTGSLDELDLFGPRFVGDPWPSFAELRERAPVHHDQRTGLWLVSRHADVRAVLADPDGFIPDNALTAITPIPPPQLRVLARARFSLPPTLANNGTDSHTGLRRLVASYFTPGRVRDAEPRIRALANYYLDRLPATGSFDLVSGLAAELPCRVLLELLGLDEVDLPVLKAWSAASLELFWGRPDPDRHQALAEAAGEFHQWLAARIRAATPGSPDLFGQLAAHRAPGDRPLRVAEAVGVCYFLLIAGQETTSQLLSTLLHRLIPRADLWPRLAAGEPGLAAACVEEVLRHEPPVNTWRRIAARPATLSGVPVPRGAHLLLLLAGSGADPDVFPDPEQFCPARPEVRRHLAFGHGRHFCLGAGLARAEASVVLTEVARRLPRLELLEAEPPMLGLLSFRAPLRVLARRA